MSNILEDIGGGLEAGGDILGGVGGAISGFGTAGKLKEAARRVNYATQVRLAQQQRQGYQIQGRAEADIGAAGGTVGGSAEDILRMNASNLALDHGIIQQQGSEEAARYTSAASNALSGGWGALIGGVVKGAAELATL